MGRPDDEGAAQIIEAMFALALILLALGWVTDVMERPERHVDWQDEERDSIRGALELMDAIPAQIRNCDYETRLGEMSRSSASTSALRSILENATSPAFSFNIFIASPQGERFYETGEPEDPGAQTLVVRHMVALCDNPWIGTARQFTSYDGSTYVLRVEAWSR